MRHSNFRGFVTTYDPKAKEKNCIRYSLRNSVSERVFEFPRISFLFHMPIPKTIRKRDQEAYESGRLKHDKKPDIDNLVKLYLDCLDGIIIQGDQKVSLGPCLKLYSTEPKTVIWINETKQQVQPWELDSAFLSASECDIPSFSEQDYPYGSCDLWLQVRSLFDRSLSPEDAIPPSGSLASVHLLQESADKAY